MPIIITIANGKGGVGKSIIALNLAGALSLKNENVYLIDTDPQGTVSEWCQIRSQQNSSKLTHKHLDITSKPLNIKQLKLQLKERISAFNYVIIDSPPAINDITKTALMFSDYAIIPVTPGPIDMYALPATINIIKEGVQLKATTVKPYLLISQKTTGTVLAREAPNIYKIFNIPILKTAITKRVALAEAPAKGYTIYEYAPNNPARDEFDKLGKEVLKWQKQH